MVYRPKQGSVDSVFMNLRLRAGVIMMLGFYLAAFVYSPVGVPHIHHEEDIHQGDSCEKDACHIAVFHPGSKGRCSHQFHFTQSKEECDLCNVIMPRQVVEKVPSYSACNFEFSFCSFYSVRENAAAPLLLHADRGPPSLI
jgi:hypothetical protein